MKDLIKRYEAVVDDIYSKISEAHLSKDKEQLKKYATLFEQEGMPADLIDHIYSLIKELKD